MTARVEGALAVALAAVRTAQEVADAEQQHLPTDVWDRCSGSIGAAFDALGDAEQQLRTVER